VGHTVRSFNHVQDYLVTTSSSSASRTRYLSCPKKRVNSQGKGADLDFSKMQAYGRLKLKRARKWGLLATSEIEEL